MTYIQQTAQGPTYKGYTLEQLRQAWEKVKPHTHWKDEINTFVTLKDEHDVDRIRAAIEFYTSSRAHIERINAFEHRYWVRADGYRKSIGA